MPETLPFDSPPRILIVGPSWVGDMVMAQSLFITLQQYYPGAVLDVLAPAWSGPVLACMPQVRRHLHMPVGHGRLGWGERRALGHQLRGQYDWAIVLPNSLKSALIPWFARIPVRTGWRGELRYGLLNDLRVLDKARYPKMVERFVVLAWQRGAELPGQLPRPRLEVEATQRQQALEDLSLSQHRPVLALCPGAEFGRAKKWPEDYYAQVACRWMDSGGQVWIFGSQNDLDTARTIAGQVDGDVQVLAGRTTLEQAVALLSCADQVVSNDSGLMHVAAALDRPLVVVYGSTSPGFTPPLSDQAHTVQSTIECSPCFERTCRFGHYACLTELKPETVMKEIRHWPDVIARG
ncbi:lipopolysaccharide heptosyltransferase II [Hahella sp. SMD15-11]|uniref:lipopolysaccharide heptosyltransferase II n=1 Tax=Thermohahella caldifontis TaxID=3142973 RepID=A0AB39UWL2_9GAMM